MSSSELSGGSLGGGATAIMSSSLPGKETMTYQERRMSGQVVGEKKLLTDGLTN